MKGFTLIELLVVVLIIGILSAVVVPQYTKAVEKSRAAEAIQMLRYMHQQQQLFVLANGEDLYGKTNEELGIEMPAGFSCSWTGEEEVCCNKDWCYLNSGMALGSLCPVPQNAIAARVDGDSQNFVNHFNRKYLLEYEFCDGSANSIVCYESDEWCKMFNGNGKPI